MEFPLTGLIETNSSEEAAVCRGSLYNRRPVIAVPYVGVLGVAAVVGTLGNVVVISAVTVKHLRSRRYQSKTTGNDAGRVFIVNLALSDLIVTAFINPLAIAGLLSTRADRQGVDISVTVCLFFVILCVFTDEDKASGAKFCMVVYRRPGQGISHFGELCSPESSPEAQNWTNRPVGPRAGQLARAGSRATWAWPMRLPIRSAHWPRVGSACVDIRPSLPVGLNVRSTFIKSA